MLHTMSRIRALSILLGWMSATALAQTPAAAPETFVAMAEVGGREAAASATVTIRLEKYMDERDRTTLAEALKVGGYPRFLPAFRKAPDVGSVEMNGRKVVVRWARQQPSGKGRTISVVTDGALFFVGGGSVDAKPRTGFELAVIQMELDAAGAGTGTMAAAARVKPGGATGVQIDDYSEAPVKLVSVRKSGK
jgi:hypothetical protein